VGLDVHHSLHLFTLSNHHHHPFEFIVGHLNLWQFSYIVVMSWWHHACRHCTAVRMMPLTLTLNIICNFMWSWFVSILTHLPSWKRNIMTRACGNPIFTPHMDEQESVDIYNSPLPISHLPSLLTLWSPFSRGRSMVLPVSVGCSPGLSLILLPLSICSRLASCNWSFLCEVAS